MSGLDVCDSCAAATFQNTTGATACINCTAGSYCPPGASVPLPCAAGTYSPKSDLVAAQSECTPARAGFFSGVGATTDTPCPIGEFNARVGQARCQRCGKGTFQDEIGQTACKICMTGFWCTAEEAVPCGEDTYQPLVRQSRQSSPAIGSTQTRSQTSVGQTRSTDCICRAGFYITTEQGTVLTVMTASLALTVHGQPSPS